MAGKVLEKSLFKFKNWGTLYRRAHKSNLQLRVQMSYRSANGEIFIWPGFS